MAEAAVGAVVLTADQLASGEGHLLVSDEGQQLQKELVAAKRLPVLEGVRPQFGAGREELPDGGYYEGPFRFGKRHGTGVLVANADATEHYKGQFALERFEGEGTKTWADGSVYAGSWKAGRKDGHGVLTETTGRRYMGQWFDGRRHGVGTQTFDMHTSYEGRWVNGQQHGTGKYIDTKGDTVYEGKWANGAHHGVGMVRSRAGGKERLEYQHGALVSREVLPAPTAFRPLPK